MISVVLGAVVFDIPRLKRQIAHFSDYVDLTSEIDINRIVIPGGVDVDGNYMNLSHYYKKAICLSKICLKSSIFSS
ncbi:MAG: hypothetical protein AAF316_14360 [Cyanobacteria bacterium P01_A01_bin.80]